MATHVRGRVDKVFDLWRSEAKHYLLGQPSPLPSATLPTNGEVINYVKWMQETKGKISRRTPESSIFHTVAAKVRAMWGDEGIPIYDQKYVVKGSVSTAFAV